MIHRAFFLTPHWAALVVSGEKSWELRTAATRIRERVGIIQTGSKAVVAVCNLVASHGPLSEDELQATFAKHRTLPADRQRPEGSRPYRHAWELADVRKLIEPVPYRHIPGTQGWARIDPDVAAEVARQASSRMDVRKHNHLI
jgi:hypothetical protein